MLSFAKKPEEEAFQQMLQHASERGAMLISGSL